MKRYAGKKTKWTDARRNDMPYILEVGETAQTLVYQNGERVNYEFPYSQKAIDEQVAKGEWVDVTDRDLKSIFIVLQTRSIQWGAEISAVGVFKTQEEASAMVFKLNQEFAGNWNYHFDSKELPMGEFTGIEIYSWSE